MKIKSLIAAATVVGASMAGAQTGERSLLAPGKFWTAGGSEQTNRTVKDPAVTGGKAIQIVSTGKNSKYSANVSYRLAQAFEAGETITISGQARAEQPTRLSISVDLAEAPYTRVGGGEFDVGTQWAPYTIRFVVPANQAAGSTRAVIQLNSEARTVSFGPLSVTASR